MLKKIIRYDKSLDDKKEGKKIVYKIDLLAGKDKFVAEA
jgi:hypothetical protein